MAKKKTARTAEQPAKSARTKRSKLAIRVSDEERRKRGANEQLHPLSVFLLDSDLEKLDAICEEFCTASRVAGARISIKRWHRHLVRTASRPGFNPAPRPELEQTVGRKEGHDTKIYAEDSDMDRLRHLASLTDCKTMGRIVRAAIGWLYERLDD